MKKHIPNVLTSLNLVTGSLGCIAVIQGRTDLAIYYILVAGVFDFLDGFAARLLNVRSAIGKELDSLADMISFGLLPALFMYKLIGAYDDSRYLTFAGLLIAVFSAIRLAKFNIDENQSDKFIGLPTPANAIMITSIALLPEELGINSWTLTIIAIASCYLMVSNITMIALKFKGAGWDGNQLRYVLVMVCLVLVIIFRANALAMIIPLYILISIFGNLGTRNDV